MKKISVWVLSALFMSLPVFSVSAESIEEKAVSYRQGVFSIMAWNIGPMVQMMKRKIPYDKEVFASNAARIATVAPMVLEGFIPDSRTDDSNAKKKIWSNMDDFKTKMKELEKTSVALAKAAETGEMANIGPAFQGLGKACKSCHDEYRDD